MPWIVGIDEAGYGPNLGPFVMTSVACRLPHDPAQADLWQLLKGAVRRRDERDDGRVLIEDSKVVYSTAKGLKALERGVLVSLHPGLRDLNGSPPRAQFAEFRGDGLSELPLVLDTLTLAGWIDAVAPAAQSYLREECWYTGRTALPVAADREDLRHTAKRFQQSCCQAKVVWACARSVIVCPPRFNGVLERSGSKSVVLMLALAELLQQNLYPDDSVDPVFVCIDKHGGRNNYAALLQQAVPEGRIVAQEEGRERSCYRIEGLKRDYQLVFQPRAESSSLCVALASMLAKYLRELLMIEFNGFWKQHLPDLKPTAGYPGDAARFLDAIRPVATQLGIADTALWRQK